MSKKHHNSPEQKAKMAHEHNTEFGEEYGVKKKPAPGHREQKKHKKI